MRFILRILQQDYRLFMFDADSHTYDPLHYNAVLVYLD